jgi:membrane protein
MGVHRAFEAAAAVAFWFFLSLVPLLVMAGFLVGQVVRARGVNALVAPLLEVVPTTAEDIVRTEVERLAGASSAPLAPLGVAGYLWTVSSGLHSLMDVFARAAPVKPRAWWKQRSIALGWVIVGLAATVSIAWVLVRVDAVLRRGARHSAFHAVDGQAPWTRPARAIPHIAPGFYSPDRQAIAAVLMLVVGTTLLAGFYRLAVAHPRGVRRRIWPGAVTAVLCWLVVSWAFGAYAASIADYAVYYGGLAAVAVLLVWLYLTSLSLMVGAEVNAQLEAGHGRSP